LVYLLKDGTTKSTFILINHLSTGIGSHLENSRHFENTGG